MSLLLIWQKPSSNDVSVDAGLASGSGAASNASASVAPSSGAGSGTGAASNGSASLAPSAGAGSGTGAAGGPSSSVSPTAGAGSGTGAAYDATVITAVDGTASAEAAAGTGAAGGASASIASSSGASSAAGSAGSASTSLATSSGAGTATGAAGGPASSVALTAGVGSGTGSAGAASDSIKASAGAGSGTGAAYDATVTTESSTAFPGAATGTGTAYGPSRSIAPHGGLASGTGIGQQAKCSVKASAGTATGTGTAYAATVDATTDVSVNAGVAAGSGTAYNPSSVAILVDGVDPITDPTAVRCTRFFLRDVDITDIVILKQTFVESAAQGKGATSMIIVRDLGQDPREFITGSRVRIDLGSGAPIYQGYLLRAARRFWFDVDDPDKLQRQWALTCVDINVLFSKRIVYKKSHPATIDGPTFVDPMYDDTAIGQLVAGWLDLSQDDLDTSSLVDRVGKITVAGGQPTYPWQGSMLWGDAMATIAALPAAIFYIDPDRRLVYADVDVENAPFALSDHTVDPPVTTSDGFGRVVGAGTTWGTGAIGTWADNGTDGNLSVDGSVAMLDATGDYGFAAQQLPVPSTVTDQTVWRVEARFRWPSPLGAQYPWFEFDFYDSPHDLDLYLDYSPDYSPDAPGPHIYFSVGAGAPGFDYAQVYLDPPTPGGWANVVMEWDSVNETLSGKYWPDGDSEPDWLTVASTAGLTLGDLTAPDLLVFGGVTDGGHHMEFDDIAVAGSTAADTPVDARGYREASIEEIADLMTNDYLALGFGRGRAAGVYKRLQDASSIALHDRWQDARIIYDIYKQATINRHADAVVNGSPSSRRGHKDDRVVVKCVTYAHGLRVGQRVRFINEAHDFDDVIPIRTMRMTFPTPCDVRYELMLSHEYDADWSLFDKLPVPRIPSPKPVYPVPPQLPGGDGGTECGGCDGIFDTFSRVLPVVNLGSSSWGTSDALVPYFTLPGGATGTTAFMGVDGERGVLRLPARPANGVSEGLGTRGRFQIDALQGLTSMDETFTIEISPLPNLLSDAGEQYYNIVVCNGEFTNRAHVRWVPLTGFLSLGSNLNSLDNRDQLGVTTIAAAPSVMTFRIMAEMDTGAGTLHVQVKAWTSGSEPGSWDIDETYTNGVNTNGDDIGVDTYLTPFYLDNHWLNTIGVAGTHDIYNYFDNFYLTLDGVVQDACAGMSPGDPCPGCVDAYVIDDFTNRVVNTTYPTSYTLGTSSMLLPWTLGSGQSGDAIDLNSTTPDALRLVQGNSSNTGQIMQQHTLAGAAPGSKTVTWAFMVDHVGDGNNGPTGTGGTYVQMGLGNASVWLRMSTGSLSASVPGEYEFAADNGFQIVAKTDWQVGQLYYVKVEVIEYKTAKFKLWLATEDEPDWMLTDTYIQRNSGDVFVQATNRAHPQSPNVVTFTGITAESSACSEQQIAGTGQSCESPVTTDNRHFQTRQPFMPGSSQVFIDGLRKRNPTDYTEDPSGAEIIFGATLSIQDADRVYVCYLVDEGFAT